MQYADHLPRPFSPLVSLPDHFLSTFPLLGRQPPTLQHHTWGRGKIPPSPHAQAAKGRWDSAGFETSAIVGPICYGARRVAAADMRSSPSSLRGGGWDDAPRLTSCAVRWRSLCSSLVSATCWGAGVFPLPPLPTNKGEIVLFSYAEAHSIFDFAVPGEPFEWCSARAAGVQCSRIWRAVQCAPDPWSGLVQLCCSVVAGVQLIPRVAYSSILPPRNCTSTHVYSLEIFFEVHF